jgi:hypothetical protein
MVHSTNERDYLASEIRYRVKIEISSLEKHLKELKENIGDNLANDIVSLTLNKKTSEGLLEFCSNNENIAPAGFQDTIEKINKKLKFVDRILEFLTKESITIDPQNGKSSCSTKKTNCIQCRHATRKERKDPQKNRPIFQIDSTIPGFF